MGSARRKNPIKKSTIVKILIVLAVILLAGFILVTVLKNKVRSKFDTGNTDEVQSTQVTTGSISTTVSGSGTLSNEDSEDTYISGTVDVTEVYVKAGDNVAEGDMLASVNSASVVKAMKEIQDSIDALDEKLGDLEEEDISEKITAGVDGRVKMIYAKEGESAADTMYENSALMLISADGYLAVDVTTDTLKEGDSVTVTTTGGTEYSGTVDSVWAGAATVLISDDTANCNATVTVAKDGTEIGSGNLYIHEEVAVTGFTGTVDSVDVSVNDKVSAGDTLLTITDASSTVNYATLLEQRADLEEDLEELIVIYKEGAVYAKSNGMVTSISQTEDSTTTTTTASTSGRSQGTSFTTVTDDSTEEDGTTISICPTDIMTLELSVDETDILSLEVGQTAAVTVSSLGDDTYTGTITEIDTVGSSSGGVTSYTATLSIEKVDGMLDGMSASAVITIEGKDSALLLPVAAVHQTSSTSYVFTTYDEESGEYGGMTEVSTGISNSQYIEITSGLSEGDTVYYTDTDDQNGFSFGDMSNFDPSSMGGGMSMPGGSDSVPSMGGGSGSSGGSMPSMGGGSGSSGGGHSGSSGKSGSGSN